VGYDKGRDWFTVADSLNNRVEVIQLPGSSGGGDLQAAINRGLAGPLRACCFPLILLLVALVVWIVVRTLRRRKAAKDAAEEQAAYGEVEAPVAEAPQDYGTE
jgi:hypothetical protein